MKREDFDRALQNLDQDLLNEVAEKRHHNLYDSKQTAKNPKKKPFFSPARISAIAAVLCFAILAVAIYPVLQNHPFDPPAFSTTEQGYPVTTPAPMTTYETTVPPATTTYHTTVPPATTTYHTTAPPVTTVVATTAATTPDTTKVTVTEETTTATPQDYETIDESGKYRLQEILATEPYASVLPEASSIPYHFKNAYYKENIYLDIRYMDIRRTEVLQIHISCNAKSSPDSLVAETLTRESIKSRITVYPGGLTTADFTVLYGDTSVRYVYNGPYMDTDSFADMVLSSPYIRNLP